MRDVWFGGGIKSLKSKDLSPPVASVKPKVCLGQFFISYCIRGRLTNAQMQEMLRTLTLKVDALASMGSGGSRDDSAKSKSKTDASRRQDCNSCKRGRYST